MSESIDLVFVSNSTGAKLWEMTRNAIRTAVKDANFPVGMVVTVEQCRHAAQQPIGRTLYYDFEFNYNKCLNLGMSLCKSKYIAFCNNDLYFETGWAGNAIAAMKKNKLLSASPTSKHTFAGVREGYTIGRILLGWCIITDRAVFDQIGKFDEPVRFWYSDNTYSVQLKLAGIKHALIGNSRVRHLGSITLKKIKDRERASMMKKQKKLFDQYKIKKYADSGVKIETERRRHRSKQRV